MDFIALDLETADRANAAPCSIGLVEVKDGQIVDRKYYLINPETEFNPYAVRVHKITPEMVEDAPTLPEIWPELQRWIKGKTLAIHNADYDLSVLQKAAERYHLALPSFQCFCTLEASRSKVPCKSYKLGDVCKQLCVSLELHHNALADAEACAGIALRLLDMGLDLSDCLWSFVSDDDLFDGLPEFEQAVLREVVGMFAHDESVSGLLRWSKGRDKLLRIFAYYCIARIGCVRSRYFIAVDEKHLHLVDGDLEHDGIKAYQRFYLDRPEDVHMFERLIKTSAHDAAASWKSYKNVVSERTWTEHFREYKRDTIACDLVNDMDQFTIDGFNNSMERSVYQELRPTLEAVLGSYWIGADKLLFQERKAYSSVCLLDESHLLLRLCFRGNNNYIAIPSSCRELIPAGVNAAEAKDGYIKIFVSPDDITDTILALVRAVADAEVMAFPSSFGCCALYEQCSDARKCLRADDGDLYLGCYYRKNLKNGKVFYGENPTIPVPSEDGEPFQLGPISQLLDD